MARMVRVTPEQRVPLKLTRAQRTLLVEALTCLPREYEQILQTTPANQPVMLTLDDLEELGGYVAAEANHAADSKLQKKLDAVFEKIQRVLDTHTVDEPPRSLKIEDAQKAKLILDQSVQLAEFAAKALTAAERLGIKNKSIERFPLPAGERLVLAMLPSLTPQLRGKLAKSDADFTVVEVATMTLAVAEALPEGEPLQQVALLMAAKSLMDCLHNRILGPPQPATRKRRPAKQTAVLFQFRITLLDVKPAIWRRIQAVDCTLGVLHEYLQAAFGWENFHLHQFEIGGARYGPWVGDDHDIDVEDESKALLSHMLPASGQRTRWVYEYDFGDGWRHEMLFEGRPSVDRNAKYPVCLEGQRACPPEDCGGPWGYAEYLAALADPKHEQHQDLVGWRGPFDPDAFDADAATKDMSKVKRPVGDP